MMRKLTNLSFVPTRYSEILDYHNVSNEGDEIGQPQPLVDGV